MVSVVIATYNYGKYISQALQSLVDQSVSDWECIVVDDGSQDDTGTVMSEWIKRDARIQYHVQKNAGPSVARNNGIKKAKGDYILFLDADDWFQPDKLKTHLNAFAQHPEIDIAYGDVRYFKDGNSNELFYSLKPDNKPWIPQLKGKGNVIYNVLMKQNIMGISSPLIKKAVFEKAGMFDENIHRLEDWELFQRMALCGSHFYYVGDANSWVMVRSHTSSLSRNEKGMRNYFLPILEKHLMKSKLSFSMRMYVLVRVIEEYTDWSLGYFIRRNDLPKHYFQGFIFVLPIVALLFLPFYVVIKIFRAFRKS